jgi:uncharacterized protein (DUF924 family)
MAELEITPEDILDFWYASDISIQWFNSTQSLDMRILQEYESIWQRARDGRLDDWRSMPQGCLALAIILDQFPLNMFRNKPESFSTESLAIEISLWAISQGFDQQLPNDRLAFLYMPLMHSENLDHQDRSVGLFEAAGLENNARFARHHRDIVKRFGRFPHRNMIMGRTSTREELDWLASDEAFKG